MRVRRKKRANSARAGRKRFLVATTAGLSLVGSALGGLTAGTKLTCHGEATTTVETSVARNGPKGTSAVDSEPLTHPNINLRRDPAQADLRDAQAPRRIAAAAQHDAPIQRKVPQVEVFKAQTSPSRFLMYQAALGQINRFAFAALKRPTVALPKGQDQRPYVLQVEDTPYQAVTRLRLVRSVTLLGNEDVSSVWFSEDGSTAFVQRKYGGTAVIWNPKADSNPWVKPCFMILFRGAECLSRNGDDTWVIIDTQTDKTVFTLPKVNNFESRLNFVRSPSGTLIARIGIDTMSIIRTTDGSSVTKFDSESGYDKVVFSKDDKYMIAHIAGGRTFIYDLLSKKTTMLDVLGFEGSESIVISNNNERAAIFSGSHRPQVFSLSDGAEIPVKFDKDAEVRFGDSWEAAFLGDDAKIVMRSSVDRVGIWDLSSGAVVELPTKAKAIDVSIDRFLTLSTAGVAELWDVNGKKIATLDESGKPIVAAAIAHESNGILAVTAGSLSYWNDEGGH